MTPAAAMSKPKVRLQLKRLELHNPMGSFFAAVGKTTRTVFPSGQHDGQAEAHEEQRPESAKFLQGGDIHVQREDIPNVRGEYGKLPKIPRGDVAVAQLNSLEHQTNQHEYGGSRRRSC